MSPYAYLQQWQEDVPAWLDRFEAGDGFPREAFFASRIVFYPGSGTDGHPVKLFGSTHCAHCFVYADYGLTRDHLERELEHPEHGFRGYHALARVELGIHDLVPNGWATHLRPGEIPPDALFFAAVAATPFGFLEVLERDRELDDTHGARRVAILFLGADGIATYDALFCQDGNRSSPFAALIHDHGFGGNYERFGRDGLLERIARSCDVLPAWLLVGDNTQPWQGYERVADVEGDHGGMHNTLRALYARQMREGLR